MNLDHDRHVARWLEHIRALAEEIGPRGSTTEGEHRGSAHCEQALARLGLEPQVEPFTSARSIYLPHLLAAATMLVAFDIYPLAGHVSAAIAPLLALVALVSDLMELNFRDNILRRLVPKAPSQNVVTVVPPAGEHRQDLVLMGHADSHRTPIVLSTRRWVAIYRAFTTVAFVIFLAQVVLYVLGTVTQWAWIWPVSIVGTIGAVLLAAMCLQADSTPFSAGANDNASGVGLVLALGEHLQAEPLRHTRAWLACTGCEEVQHYGAIDFYRRHRAELVNAVALVFEMLGGADPAWLTKEGIIIPFHADRDLMSLAEQVAGAHPEWGATATQVSGGNTEMADALRAGVAAITFIGTGSRGEMVYWHQTEDTYDKMDPAAMGRAYAFTRAFIQALDERTAKEQIP